MDVNSHLGSMRLSSMEEERITPQRPFEGYEIVQIALDALQQTLERILSGGDSNYQSTASYLRTNIDSYTGGDDDSGVDDTKGGGGRADRSAKKVSCMDVFFNSFFFNHTVDDQRRIMYRFLCASNFNPLKCVHMCIQTAEFRRSHNIERMILFPSLFPIRGYNERDMCAVLRLPYGEGSADITPVPSSSSALSSLSLHPDHVSDGRLPAASDLASSSVASCSASSALLRDTHLAHGVGGDKPLVAMGKPASAKGDHVRNCSSLDQLLPGSSLTAPVAAHSSQREPRVRYSKLTETGAASRSSSVTRCLQRSKRSQSTHAVLAYTVPETLTTLSTQSLPKRSPAHSCVQPQACQPIVSGGSVEGTPEPRPQDGMEHTAPTSTTALTALAAPVQHGGDGMWDSFVRRATRLLSTAALRASDPTAEAAGHAPGRGEGDAKSDEDGRGAVDTDGSLVGCAGGSEPGRVHADPLNLWHGESDAGRHGPLVVGGENEYEDMVGSNEGGDERNSNSECSNSGTASANYVTTFVMDSSATVINNNNNNNNINHGDDSNNHSEDEEDMGRCVIPSCRSKRAGRRSRASEAATGGDGSVARAPLPPSPQVTGLSDGLGERDALADLSSLAMERACNETRDGCLSERCTGALAAMNDDGEDAMTQEREAEVEMMPAKYIPPHQPINFNALLRPIVDIMHSYMPMSLHYADKEGHPVMYIRLEFIHYHKMINDLGNMAPIGVEPITLITLFYTYMLEILQQVVRFNNTRRQASHCHPTSSTSEVMNSCVVVIDAECEHFNRLLIRAMPRTLHSLFTASQQHYPELLKHLYVVNCKKTTRILYFLWRNVLSRETRQKITFCTAKHTVQTLGNVIAREMLPRCYGGFCQCPGGCIPIWKANGGVSDTHAACDDYVDCTSPHAMTTSANRQGGVAKAEWLAYRNSSSPLHSTSVGVQSAAIECIVRRLLLSPRKRETVVLSLQPNDEVIWEFVVKNNMLVVFSVLFIPATGNGGIIIVEPKERKCKDASHFVAKEFGTVVLKLLNGNYVGRRAHLHIRVSRNHAAKGK